MSSQYVIDLPALGASPATIAACLAERLDSPYVAEADEVLSVRLVTSALFEVRGTGDVELNAQLLARAAIDYGFRVLHVVVLDVLAREWLLLPTGEDPSSPQGWWEAVAGFDGHVVAVFVPTHIDLTLALIEAMEGEIKGACHTAQALFPVVT